LSHIITPSSLSPCGHDLSAKLRLAVGIATAGRRDILSEALRELEGQTRRPDMVFISPAVEADVNGAVVAALTYDVRVVKGSLGSTFQRNAIIDVAQDFDVMAFFDDDFFAHPTYLEEMERCFASMPDIVAASGLVIADGVKGPGLPVAAAKAVLLGYSESSGSQLTDQYNAYGCNMCVRLAPVYARDLRFDENLPLYGWLEDVDFCRQVSKSGRVVKNTRMIGVHLGAKGGRTSGVRFGYSQIANPIYTWRKGSTDFFWASRHIRRNVLANLRGLIWSEPWVDRRGRLKGNALAVCDLIKGKLRPDRILNLT
jgi:GT2 family glycosyltransferase